MATKRGLGKGLGALMADATAPEGGVTEMDIYLLDNNKDQPRKQFDKEKLEELAQSIRLHGIMQPVIVHEKEGRYVIVAGERRFRAAKLAGLKQVPVIVREYDDQEILELSLIENIQREDLNPMEQAAALQQLTAQYKLKQEEVAERVGKSRPAIANLMRLLSLPEPVKKMVLADRLSAGHARALLPLEDAKTIQETAELVAGKSYSVRQTEDLVKLLLNPPAKKKTKPAPSAPAELKAAEEELQTALETKVKIQGDLKKGKIIIDYYTKAQLEQLYEYLRK